VGDALGVLVGITDGIIDGTPLGTDDGFAIGAVDGLLLGVDDGLKLGYESSSREGQVIPGTFGFSISHALGQRSSNNSPLGSAECSGSGIRQYLSLLIGLSIHEQFRLFIVLIFRKLKLGSSSLQHPQLCGQLLATSSLVHRSFRISSLLRIHEQDCVLLS